MTEENDLLMRSNKNIKTREEAVENADMMEEMDQEIRVPNRSLEAVDPENDSEIPIIITGEDLCRPLASSERLFSNEKTLSYKEKLLGINGRQEYVYSENDEDMEEHLESEEEAVNKEAELFCPVLRVSAEEHEEIYRS